MKAIKRRQKIFTWFVQSTCVHNLRRNKYTYTRKNCRVEKIFSNPKRKGPKSNYNSHREILMFHSWTNCISFTYFTYPKKKFPNPNNLN